MDNFRPGVYTSFAVNSDVLNNNGKKIAVVAVTDKTNVANKILTVNSYAKAREIFGVESTDNEVMVILKAIFLQTSTKISVIGILDNTTQSYKNALDMLKSNDDYIICFGNAENDFLSYASQTLQELEKQGKEKIAIFSSKSVSDATEKALVNNKRIIITFPKITLDDIDVNVSSGVLCSLISNLDNIVFNLNGSAVLKEFKLSEKFDDEQIKTLIDKGVCVFENNADFITLIRAVTTKTTDSEENYDYTYKNLSTVLVIDTVIPDIRNILKNRLLNSSNNTATLSSVMALIVDKLDFYKDMNFISSYKKPIITLSEEDSSICLVNLDFTIVQGVYQVYLNVLVSV